jgi:branched-chain amino acid transport system ATP-binding protein
MLKVTDVEAMYGRAILVLRGVTFEVPERSIVALLGANGAGKSTTLKAISGLIRSENGEVTHGRIELDGRRLDRLDAAEVVRCGVMHVMEGRHVFQHLTVHENLIAGAHTLRNGSLTQKFDLVYHYFPRLAERRTTRAGYLSGGEQQMLAIGRALMAEPRILLLDEPSLGLSPMLVREIFEIIQRINRENGTTILLVEQNARLALTIAAYAYVMENGRIVLSGPADQLSKDEGVREFYLGVTASGERKSYRDVKHYRRHRSWLA